MPPLFSILIPSRNRLELLRLAVESVVSQNADFEIIIADNASQPAYTDYVASLGPVAARSLRSEESLPVTENWNRALSAATGQYIIMLGDDDALCPAWLEEASLLIRRFGPPDALYAMAYHYAYPHVVPGHEDGYFATVDNSELFRQSAQPYVLPAETARKVGQQALRFRHWFSFNSQHFIWSRQFINARASSGPFFQGPYPDYYSSIMTMLTAAKIIVVPSPQVIIGISPKSFGFFYNAGQFDAGQQMLGNADGNRPWAAGLSAEIVAAAQFPGSAHYRNWLTAALLVARNLGLAPDDVVDLRRYRRLQILEIFSGHYDRTLDAAQRFALLQPHMRKLELRLWRRLGWLERLSPRLPLGKDVIRERAGAMGAIYTRAIVTFHDIGAHNSIADALRWLQSAAENAAANETASAIKAERYDELAAAYGALHGYAAALRAELVALRNSTSWRITAPLRNAVWRMKGGSGPPSAEIPPLPSYNAPPMALPATKPDNAAAPVPQAPLPIIEPLTAAEDGTTIAVVYLARSADGSVDAFAPFIASYRAHDAGVPHDLIVIRKGLVGRYGSHAALALMLEGIAHRTVDIPDDGFDIQAYLKVAPALRHDRVCFLNTFSEIKADGWLRKLNTPLDRSDVGVTGATGSYESLSTSLVLLSKVIWLTAVRNIQYSPEIAAQFQEVLLEHAPGWMNRRIGIQAQLRYGWAQAPRLLKTPGKIWRRIKHETVRPALNSPADTGELEDAFAKHWEAVTKPGAALFPFRDVKPFPNPHLRSNAFMIRRNLLLELDFKLDNTKPASNRFESAPDGLPTRLARLGLSSILVGADGVAYEAADWPESRTFRLGDQANVLVSDNQVRAFDAMSDAQKRLHVRLTWGDYVPGSGAGLMDFGVTFARGSLDLAPPPAGALPMPASEPALADRLSFSVVIPTHNRLALLRDAVDSILRQPGDHWECVVFDNASEEPIGAYVESLNDRRIRFDRSETFLPVTESWNRAIDLATGAYVTLIGDDDGLVPGYFEKLEKIALQFNRPKVIYSALYQFFHPTVAPWQRAGYVVDMRNGFFFKDRSEPFLLTAKEAREAVIGSLTLHRKFTFNMQAFAFSRSFLAQARIDGKVFKSPFPDYYLANVAMGMAETIAVSPEPLAVAGVSRASFGYTLFNNLEEKGAALLNATLSEDGLYEACEPHLLPGPAYNTNYIITMSHVVRRLGDRAPAQVDFQRYRRLQIFAAITAQDRPDWMRAPPGSLLWRRLSGPEKTWAAMIGLLNWRAQAGQRLFRKALDGIKRSLDMTGFSPIVSNQVVGGFARLPELLVALENGTYPGQI